MGELRVTILGCGSSGGVPRLGGVWGQCDPDNPKNTRRRCSILVEKQTQAGTTSVLIDTSPDMRQQLLDAGIERLDGVVYTHSHADHVHGLDDLRMIVFNTGQRLNVYADADTQNALIDRFGYAFVQPPGSDYPPILNLNAMDGDVVIEGLGGAIRLTPFEVAHGRITAQGFRIHNLAYLPDVSDIPDQAWPVLQGLDCWVVDALRRDPHPSHAHLDKTLNWIKRARPKQAVLTNMHTDMDYQTVLDETPDHVVPAYDGMILRYDI